MNNKKSVVGNLINFRGLVYSPVSEQGVVFLFGKIIEDLHMYIEEIKTSYPDCIGRRYTGKGWEKVAIEFEYKSSNFLEHQHDSRECDIIVCWEHDWKDCPKELQVIELKEAIKELPSEPIEPPDIVAPEYDLVHHYKRKKMTRAAINLYERFDQEIKKINEEIWRKIAKTAVSYYCPERVFCYVWFRKNGLLIEIFTRGNKIEGIKSYPRYPKWGTMSIKSEKDLDIAIVALKNSFQLIREAVKNNEPTGGYTKIEECPETN